ncbi:MAG: hypothetical protein K2P81_15975 [Bacteriovoracaceae bacterium]|nr:hypothetical protein [Bacteriovoracaceae bacterium]
MQPRFSRLMLSTFMTLGILIALEIGTSAFFPALGWREYRLAFNVVIILFMALKLTTPLLPWFVMMLQLVHAAFSVEGWALGTLVGILVSLIASYLKEILQFSSAIATIVTVQLFQIVWYVLTVSVICLKLGTFESFSLLFWNAMPGTLLLSLLSPVLFNLLNRVWNVEEMVNRSGMEI